MSQRRRIAWRRLRSRVRHAVGEQRRWLSGSPRGPRAALLVLGCQRSGTTLVTDLLDQDPDAKVYPEHSDVSSRDPHGLRLSPLDEVAQRLRRSRYPLVVLKPLVESQNAPRLLDGLSNARALWMFRHYADVARSNLLRFGEGNGIRNLRSIAHGGQDWRAEGASEEVRRVVGRRFSDSMNPWDAAALFWWARNRLFFERGLDARPDVRTGRYEDLVADPVRVLRGVYDFVGCEPPRRVDVSGVSTASVAAGRNVPLSGEVAALCEEMLGRLEKAHAGTARCA